MSPIPNDSSIARSADEEDGGRGEEEDADRSIWSVDPDKAIYTSRASYADPDNHTRTPIQKLGGTHL
jgi:hypothetical protein